ncbi:hypothetical protein L7F22_018385 [Adiantum nelumboides]|nr:hypothetical protein [Adiantum nelumboides]
MPFELMYEQKPIMPTEEVVMSWTMLPWEDDMTTEDLLALRIRQLERRQEDIERAKEKLKAARLKNKEAFDDKHRLRPYAIKEGDNESKEVLDAFFLGKALAEAVTERLGTAVGELLSEVGRWQAEQQKEIREFQDEVQERAKKARAKALQEARSMERKEVTIVSQNGASTPAAGGDDKAQTVVPLKRPNAPPDSLSS